MTIKLLPETFEFIKLTDEEYFSEKYRDYISNSKLGLYNPEEGGSYAKYLTGFDNSYNESYELGSAVHAIYLQENEYEISSSVQKPTGKLGVFAEELYKLFRQTSSEEIEDFAKNEDIMILASDNADYYKGKFSETRRTKAYYDCMPYWKERIELNKKEYSKEQLYLNTVMKFKTEKCLESLQNNKDITETFTASDEFVETDIFNEYAIFVDAEVHLKDEVRLVKLKAKFDNIKLDKSNNELYINDLKTTGRPAAFFMSNTINKDGQIIFYEGAFDKYHYYRQVGMYTFLANAYFKNIGYENLKIFSNIAVVETHTNFNSILYKIDHEDIKRGMLEFKQLLINLVNE